MAENKVVVSLTVKEIKEKLERYEVLSEEIFILLQQLNNDSVGDKQFLRQLIEDKYSFVKEETKAYYRELTKSTVVLSQKVQAFFKPAIQDIHVHISQVAKNRVKSQAFSGAVYDIGSYSRYWLSHIESLKR